MGKLHEEKEKEKEKKKKRERKPNLSMLTGLLHYCTLLSKEFLLISTMPIPVEMVMPIGTTIAVHLMVLFAVNTLKDVRAWLTFFGNYSISFLVVHAIPCFLSVVFCVMSSIVFCASGGMRMTTKY